MRQTCRQQCPGLTACLCACGRSNTDEIAGSMQELERMQASVEELREQVGEAQTGLQGLGEGLLKILEMLQEASHVLGAIRESRKARPCPLWRCFSNGEWREEAALPCPFGDIQVVGDGGKRNSAEEFPRPTTPLHPPKLKFFAPSFSCGVWMKKLSFRKWTYCMHALISCFHPSMTPRVLFEFLSLDLCRRWRWQSVCCR